MSFWSDLWSTMTDLPKGGGAVNSDWSQLGNDATGALGDMGLIPKKVDPEAPGGRVDTSWSDAQRAQMEQLLSQLQDQAATGNGAWQQTLAKSVQSGKDTSSVLAMSQPGMSRMGSTRAMGEGQAAASQRGVGEGNILRAQSEQDAQGQLAGLLGGVGSGDANQSEAQASVLQQNRETNAALAQQAKQNVQGIASGAGQALGAALSDGGKVPGSAKVAGDSEVNDTVPAQIQGGGAAKLSPGELVVPRSHSDSPERAMQWIAQFFSSAHGGHNGKFAGGGDTGISTGDINDPLGSAGEAFNPLIPYGPGGLNNALSLKPRASSIENGGLLDTTNFQQTRGQVGSLEGLLSARAGGGGPSVAPQLVTNAADSAIASGMRGGTVSGAANRVAEGGVKASLGGANAAETRGKEQAQAQRQLSSTELAQRQTELALAEAQQQAAMRNTQLNAGLTLANQAALRQALGGAGQVAAAYSAAHHGGGDDYGGNTDSFSDTEFAQQNDSPPDEGGGENGGSVSDTEFAQNDGGMARGGRVMTRSGGRVMTRSGVTRASAKDLEEHNPAHNYMQKATVEEYDRQYRPASRVSDESGDDLSELEVQRWGGGSIPGYAEGGGVEETPEELMSRQPPMSPTYSADAGTQRQPGAYGNGPFSDGEGFTLSPRETAAASYAASALFPPAALPIAAGATYAGLKGNEKARGERTPNMVEPGAMESLVKGAAQTASQLATTKQPTPEQKATPVASKPGQPGLESRGLDEELKGLAGEYKAKSEGEAALAETRRGEQEMLRANQDKADTIEAEAEAAHAKAIRDIQGANEEMSKLDMSVDPGRFWASRSTGQKITGIIGMALGALGTGPDGVNRAAGMITQAIDRDIDAQKAEHEFRLKRGQAGLENLKSMYAMQHQRLGDKLSATAAARSTGLAIAATKAEEQAATTNSQALKGQLMALSGGLRKQEGIEQGKAALERRKVAANEALVASEVNKNNAAALRGPGGAAGKNAGLAQGALEAIDDLEREMMSNPASPQLAQKRASFLLELNKLQGGRFNEEIHKLNQELTPGSDEWAGSIISRLGSQLAPGLMANKFNTLRKHTLATANMPPNPEYGAD